LTTGLAVLLAALLLASGSQRAGASEHGNAPAMTAEGELRIVHIDHFDRGRSETAYLLRDTATGDTFELRFERRPPRLLRTGDRVSIRGRAVGRKLWVTEIVAGLDQEGTGEPAESEAAAAADSYHGQARPRESLGTRPQKVRPALPPASRVGVFPPALKMVSA
jgi:hypothetical protein